MSKKRRIEAILRAASIGAAACVAGSLLADDIEVPVQPLGYHSTVSVQGSTVGIRDDELASYICNCIKAHGGEVKDVKIFVNSCFGGGMLDDFQYVFGADGPCAGITWVAGSASQWNEPAWGYTDADVDRWPGKKLGSDWTSGLAGPDARHNTTEDGAMLQGDGSDKVVDDLNKARDLDRSGPNHDKDEDPVIGAGNGGDMVIWNAEDTKHEAIVFGGLQTNKRHHNNIENVKAALEDVWAGSTYNIQDIDGGTKQDLLDAIDAACERLDADTQLVIYLDDHGDWDFDFGEVWDGIIDEIIAETRSYLFDLRQGYIEGFLGMINQNEEPQPSVWMTLEDPIQSEEWRLWLNETLIPLPPGQLNGDLILPVDWTSIQAQDNLIVIESVVEPTLPMNLAHLALGSGPINESEGTIQDECNLDQNQPGTAAYMAAFAQTDLAQSFQHQEDGSICGAGIHLRAGVGTSDNVRISLWDALPNAGGTMLAEASDVGTQGQWIDVYWDPVAISANTTYFLVFDGNTTLGISGETTNPYPHGIVYANPGFNPFPDFDYSFRTYSTTGSDCLSMSVTELIAGARATWTIERASPGAQGVTVYGLQAGTTSVQGYGGYCATFDIQGVTQNRVVSFWNADAGGVAQFSRLIPGNLSGVTVLTQSAERGTCPDECVSNVDEQTIL